MYKVNQKLLFAIACLSFSALLSMESPTPTTLTISKLSPKWSVSLKEHVEGRLYNVLNTKIHPLELPAKIKKLYSESFKERSIDALLIQLKRIDNLPQEFNKGWFVEQYQKLFSQTLKECHPGLKMAWLKRLQEFMNSSAKLPCTINKCLRIFCFLAQMTDIYTHAPGQPDKHDQETVFKLIEDAADPLNNNLDTEFFELFKYMLNNPTANMTSLIFYNYLGSLILLLSILSTKNDCFLELLLLHPNFNPNEPDYLGNTILKDAIRQGNSKTVKQLLLHTSVKVPIYSIFTWRMHNRNDPDPAQQETFTLLFNHLSVNINEVENNEDRYTILHRCVINEIVTNEARIKILELILSVKRNEININAQNVEGLTPLHVAVFYGKSSRPVQLLLEHPSIDLSILTNQGQSALDLLELKEKSPEKFSRDRVNKQQLIAEMRSLLLKAEKKNLTRHDEIDK